MLRSPGGGTIITVSSVLGTLGASHLSDYSASKAALTAMHHSLAAELAQSHPQIKTILVTPGQLTTPMFQGVDLGKIRGFFAPVVEPVDVAKAVIKAIDGGCSAELAMPLYVRWVDWINVCPVGVIKVVRWISGIDIAMEQFEGRKGGVEKGSLI